MPGGRRPAAGPVDRRGGRTAPRGNRVRRRGRRAVVLAAVASTLPGPALPSARTGVVALLAVVAAVAEEAFFRRLLYGRLARWGAAVAVVGSAVAFGLCTSRSTGRPRCRSTSGRDCSCRGSGGRPARGRSRPRTHALANLMVVLR